MPAEGIHLTAMREAIATPAFPPAARAVVTRYEDASRLGAIALDLPYFDHYLSEVARYALKQNARPSPLGTIVHERAAVGIALSVLERARSLRSDRLAALGLGLVSHAALDRRLHPLVNALARAHSGGRSHDAAHREVEKLQSICFHEDYFGRPILGCDVVVRLVTVPMAELMGTSEILGTLASAFSSACGDVVLESTLARMGRGYAQHARILGSPLGKLATNDREKADAIPRFLRGAWGAFDEVLMAAVRGTVEPLESAWALYVANDADAEDARTMLMKALPLGTIDPQGEDVDLERPYS